MDKDRNFILPKSFHLRVIELSQSILIVKDCLYSIKKGKRHQLIPLYGQLRSLLVEKSKKNPSLLIDIANLLQFDLTIYYVPQFKLASEFQAISQASTPELSLIKRNHRQKKTTLLDFLDSPVFTLKGKDFTAREIITLLANNVAGSHYSEKIPKNIAKLFSYGLYGSNEFAKLGIPNSQALNNIIIEIGEFIYKLGLKLIREISEFEIFTQLYIPNQKLEEDAFIFDLNYKSSLIRTALFFNKNFELFFFISDHQGSSIRIGIDKQIDFDKPFLINISYGFTDRFETIIQIYIDNVKVAEEMIENIIGFRNDFSSFTYYQNRSIEDSKKGFYYGMESQAIFQRKLSPRDKGQVTLGFESNITEKSKYIWLEKGLFGFSNSEKSTTKDLKFEGNVKVQTIDEYLKNKNS